MAGQAGLVPPSPPRERLAVLRQTAARIQHLERQLSGLDPRQPADVLAVNQELSELRDRLIAIHTQSTSPTRPPPSPPADPADADREELEALRAAKWEWDRERARLNDRICELEQEREAARQALQARLDERTRELERERSASPSRPVESEQPTACPSELPAVSKRPAQGVGLQIEQAFSQRPDEDQLLPKAAEMTARLFETLDANQNGTIELDELKLVHGGDADELFGHMDSDSDGLITRDEFRLFFSRLGHAKGSNTVELLIEYLQLNAQAVAQGEEVAVLPVCQLLLDNFNLLKPAAVYSPEQTLSDAERARASKLFEAIDTLGNGLVRLSDVLAVWGGGSIGLFDQLALDAYEPSSLGTEVSLNDWVCFVEQILQAEGPAVLKHALNYFERELAAQKAVAETTGRMRTAWTAPVESWRRPEHRETLASLFDQRAVHAHPAEGLMLSGAELQRLDVLFDTVDLDADGAIELDELKLVHGGDADELFGHMDSDSDGLITRDEFRLFFSRLGHAKGSNTVELLIEYLQLNAQAVAQGEEVAVLPVCQLLLDNFNLLKPAAVYSPEQTLSEAERARASKLFEAIDTLGNGLVRLSDVLAVWGGGSIGLFDVMPVGPDGQISIVEWLQYLSKVVQLQGHTVLGFALSYFERAIRAQTSLHDSLNARKQMLGPMAAPSISEEDTLLFHDSSPQVEATAKPTAAPSEPTAEPKPESKSATATAQIVNGLFECSVHSHPSDRVLLLPKALGMVDKLFDLLDVDQSTVLEPDEIRTVHGGDPDRLFEHMDTNSDGVVSRFEFRMFFSQLAHAKGSRAVELLVEYLCLNARSLASGSEVAVLPVCQLLLDNFNLLKPAAVHSPEQTLSGSQRDRATKLFCGVGSTDIRQPVQKEEIVAVWGGNSIGLFDKLGTNDKQEVTLELWLEYLESMVKDQGERLLDFALQYFERVIAVQEMFMSLPIFHTSPLDVES